MKTNLKTMMMTLAKIAFHAVNYDKKKMQVGNR